jgi:hypothetical protein
VNRVEKQIAALALVARPVLEGIGYQSNCCVLASRAALDVLKGWDIKARPLLCEVVAANFAFRSGGRDPVTAYVVQCDAGIDIKPGEREMREKAGGLNGHVVLAAKVGRRHMLLDMSAWGFSRPTRDIHIPSGVVFDSRGPIITPKWQLSVDLKGMGCMLYRSHPAPERERFQSASDWTLPTDKHQEMHRGTVAALRQYAEETVKVAVFE